MTNTTKAYLAGGILSIAIHSLYTDYLVNSSVTIPLAIITIVICSHTFIKAYISESKKSIIKHCKRNINYTDHRGYTFSNIGATVTVEYCEQINKYLVNTKSIQGKEDYTYFTELGFTHLVAMSFMVLSENKNNSIDDIKSIINIYDENNK